MATHLDRLGAGPLLPQPQLVTHRVLGEPRHERAWIVGAGRSVRHDGY